MIALLFEVKPAPGKVDAYLAYAASLRDSLNQSGGCDFIDRYRNLADDGWLLSYQLWRDEAAMARWRTHGEHHIAQTAGRQGIFDDYRLRVAQVLRVETPGKPAWQATRLNTYNDPAVTPPRIISITESDIAAQPNGPAWQYESLYRPGQFARVEAHASYASALDASEQCAVNGGTTYRICEVQRDYSMRKRREAPTYYPPVA
jgi:heme-degrading monooxygenase HmoA